MRISLNWIRDFVDLPADLDPHELAERFTRTTAEVDEVIRISVGASGLVIARVEQVLDVPGTRGLWRVVLDIGCDKTVDAITAAPAMRPRSNLVFAPLGSSLAALGKIAEAEVAGRKSFGMIPPAEALGIAMATQEAVTVSDVMTPGQTLDPAMFDDWVMEIDNKSITHRPDLWGHYGIAREIAAICKLPFRSYDAVSIEELSARNLPEVKIHIADSAACRRYSGIILKGVSAQPAPLWMQLRLGAVGLRPINALVDLTNYVCADLGQPMHAFDAAKVDRIEVAWAADGERFTTLDGVERRLSPRHLMIQCGGRSIALAGVMGGRDTEVSAGTTSILLESACFDPATIRTTAAAMGLRTDASARFEKSLDPAHTVLSIRRFIHLARPEFPGLAIASRLADCYPRPLPPVAVPVRLRQVSRTIGREVGADEARRLLEPLGFKVTGNDTHLAVAVPSFRATNDISIEADVIEEIARCVGFGCIAPALPRVSVRRFPPNVLHQLEQGCLDYFTRAGRFHEIHGYIWYDAVWLDRLGIDPGPCIELVNPPAEESRRLRRSLLPGLLASVARNRFHFPALSILELGSIFEPGGGDDHEFRHLGLIVARRGKRGEDQLLGGLKGALTEWGWQQLTRSVAFQPASPAPWAPWQHAHRTATVEVDGAATGRISVLDPAILRVIDEHLAAWSVAWAELRLNTLAAMPPPIERLGEIPAFPLVELDFSILVPRSTAYADVAAKLASFQHKLLRCVRYVTSYEGDSLPAGRRSLTFRTVVGDTTRTLVEQDAADFRRCFEHYIRDCQYEIRQ